MTCPKIRGISHYLKWRKLVNDENNITFINLPKISIKLGIRIDKFHEQ